MRVLDSSMTTNFDDQLTRKSFDMSLQGIFCACDELLTLHREISGKKEKQSISNALHEIQSSLKHLVKLGTPLVDGQLADLRRRLPK